MVNGWVLPAGTFSLPQSAVSQITNLNDKEVLEST